MTSLRWFLVIGFLGILGLLTSLGVSVNLFGRSQAQAPISSSNEGPTEEQANQFPVDQVDPLNRELQDIPPPPSEALTESPIGEGSTSPEASETAEGEALDVLPPLPVGTYNYQREGRRDPFEPFRRVRAAMATTGVKADDLSALERWEIDKIKIIAVLWDTQNPRAVVMTPDAATHTVSKGTKIGRNFGVIKDIREGEIIVAEKIFVDGKSKTEIQVIELK
jgi:Tfp pilus assembly protein PilP